MDPPDGEKVGDAPAPYPDDVLFENEARDVPDGRHGEEVEVDHLDARRPPGLLHPRVVVPLVPTGGAQMAEARRPARYA